MKIEIEVLKADGTLKLQNSLMHAASLFEDGKQMVQYERFIVTMKPNSPYESLCEEIANVFNQMGGYCIFVGIETVDGIKLEKNYTWFEKNVQSLSIIQNDGLKWILFKDFLKTRGYNVECDERMFVVNIS
jgi:hypothetical protein